jgi:predicted ATP-grasp superfamily ATP-dependent carboligase
MLLVIGSAGRLYREYLLRSAAERTDLWLLDAVEPTWQIPYIKGNSVVPLVDRERLIPDQRRLVELAAELAARYPVEGVWTYDETLVVTAAEVADALGLPGLGSGPVQNCRNKHRNREALTAAGLPQPRFAYVTDAAAARAAAAEIGFPVVIKPRGGGASIGVVRALAPEEVDEAFAVAEAGSFGGATAYEGGALVEEMVFGPEISVDGAVHGGEYLPFCLARKKVGLDPYFEEVGHIVDAGDELWADEELLRVLAEAHRAAGVRDGVTHTEVKLTARGPVVVEINARIGGDLIPYLGLLATGVDPAHTAVDLARGRRPELARTRADVVGIRFVYPPRDGVLEKVLLPSPEDVPGLIQAAQMAPDGTALLLPPRGFLSRAAFVICRGATAAQCEAALDQAEAMIEVGLGPLPD